MLLFPRSTLSFTGGCLTLFQGKKDEFFSFEQERSKRRFLFIYF